MRSLRVGDLVCDCQYRHVRIIQIHPDYGVLFPRFILKRLPDRLFDFVLDYWPLKEVIDKHLIVETGSHHSALSCCDPVDHDVLVHPIQTPQVKDLSDGATI